MRRKMLSVVLTISTKVAGIGDRGIERARRDVHGMSPTAVSRKGMENRAHLEVPLGRSESQGGMGFAGVHEDIVSGF